MNPQAIIAPIKTLSFYLSRVIWTLGYPLDVIWRHHMGERQAALWKVWLHVFIAGGIISGSALLVFIESSWPGSMTSQSVSGQSNRKLSSQATDETGHTIEVLNFKARNRSAFEVFAAIVFYFAFLNHFQVQNKRKQGIPWHSWFYGIPRFLPDNRLTNAWLIPLGSFAVGLWVQHFFPGLGAYILFMAVIQFLAFRFQEAREYNQWLDVQDRQISVDHMKRAIEGSDPMENAGFAVPGLRKAAQTNPADKVFRAVTTEDIADRFRDVLTPSQTLSTDRKQSV